MKRLSRKVILKRLLEDEQNKRHLNQIIEVLVCKCVYITAFIILYFRPILLPCPQTLGYLVHEDLQHSLLPHLLKWMFRHL